MPLKVGGKVIGIINVESRKVNAFDERDDRILTRVANAIAVQVDEEQRIKEAKRQMEQSEFRSRFTSEIIEAADVNAKLKISSQRVIASFRCRLQSRGITHVRRS